MDAKSLSTRRQIELIDALREAIKVRHATEGILADQHESAQEEAKRLLASRRKAINEKYRSDRQDVEATYEAERTDITGGYERNRSEAQSQYRAVRNEAETTTSQATLQAEQERKDAAWQALTIYDAKRIQLQEGLEKSSVWLTQKRQEIEAITNDTLAIAQTRNLKSVSFSPVDIKAAVGKIEASSVSAKACKQARKDLNATIEAARNQGVQLYSQKLPGLLAGPLPAGVFAGLASALMPLMGMSLGWQNPTAYIVSTAGSLAGAVITFAMLSPRSRKNTQTGFDSVDQAITKAKIAHGKTTRFIALQAEQERTKIRDRRDKELDEAGFRVGQLLSEAESKSAELLGQAGKQFPSLLAEMREEQQGKVATLEASHDKQLAELARTRDLALAEAEKTEEAANQESQTSYDEAWQTMFERWLTSFDDIRAELRDMRADCQRLFPDFSQTDYAEWTKPSEVAPAISFGNLELDLNKIEQGLSKDSRLTPPETKLAIPALMTLAETPTLLLTAKGQGRAAGVELLQTMMLRMMTAMPPGKVRFTILDPIGLGDNFQSYMHLADSDEQLIAGRIWSEQRDIDEQLARLTNHMEVVLQKYLRSEYETIHEYNAQAGEVAEPFQVLVIAGFPTNFSEASARRLVSLVTGGPRCGVYTLIGVDSKTRLPTEFQLDELKENAAWLDWNKATSQFVWQNPTFKELPLKLATVPPAEVMVETIRKAGEAAKNAVRVEVPFSVVEPAKESLWTQTCGDELVVPIGRAGANRLQNVRLGKGTSQHLLVAGKTGSGKSTFLHALVTSAAMHYSPDEVEFYLVDFKKGVEFKSYATHRLPHAKVIAIESEREFGLSVLERLDDELKSRGEKFRAAGVQNLADYRTARPNERVPRSLLIVDEFQELFVEDDRLAQESALLMDRLVRQGRAFGIHVLLGTQTLAGAYSIARSTLGQMAIRVALECSEADSHLILSDERNNAARFLSRPGEAIYNAQNGLVTANEPFQVVWLPDRERAKRLDALDEHRHSLELPKPETIVFEGNAPADPATNLSLVRLVEERIDDRPAGLAPRAWLGAAVAIKPPTHTELGQHPGANLLVVGPDEPSALGILTTATISLVAANRKAGANRKGAENSKALENSKESSQAAIYVVDGSRPGEASDGEWKKVTDALGHGLIDPKQLTLADPTGTTKIISTVAEEVSRREGTDEGTKHAPIYLVLYNAGRLRELRRREDDYSFGSSDEPKRPDQQLTDILKNGPSVGVHTLIWCDSYNSVTRLFDRQTLREFAQRVASQMSAADSSNLIDSPAASDLSVHRALFYNDETGQTEKFRPYGPPSDVWLELVSKACSER